VCFRLVPKYVQGHPRFGRFERPKCTFAEEIVLWRPPQKMNNDRHTVIGKILVHNSNFLKYKVCANIRRGSLDRGVPNDSGVLENGDT